jgi:hypothetical protein
MPKNPHPADIAAESAMIQAIRAADHFLASLFVGRGRYEKQQAPTVLAALHARVAMRERFGVNQHGMIYAVQKDGHAVFITDALIAKLFKAAAQ